jgi:hypothetical protein
MRHQVAGLVADLAESASVVPALQAWKSDRSLVGAVPLLLALFRDEEVRLGFDRPTGAITNLWAPLRRHAEAAVAAQDGEAAAAAAAATAAAAGAVAAGADKESGGSPSAGAGGAKKSFARLASALQQSASAQAERALKRAVETQDLRAKVTGGFARAFAVHAHFLCNMDRVHTSPA